MRNKLFKVILSKEDRKCCLVLINKGRELARIIKRANILIQCDRSDKQDQEIASIVKASIDTVKRVRKKYCLYGIKSALYNKKIYGRPLKLDKKQQAELVSICCSKVPKNKPRWTMDMIHSEAKKRGYDISRSGIHLYLKKLKLNLGK